MIRLLTFLLAASSLSAAANPAWNKPFPPHRVIGNVYYVGTSELSSYLVTTARQHPDQQQTPRLERADDQAASRSLDSSSATRKSC